MELEYKVVRMIGIANEAMSVGVLVDLPDGTTQSILSGALMGDVEIYKDLPRSKLKRQLLRHGYSISHNKKSTPENMQAIAQNHSINLKLQYGIHK
jgi:hypothetical protein